MLNDVNLDVAEQAGIQGLAALPDGFLPVLSGEDQKIWIAARAEPPAVYVPGLPVFDDDNLSALSQTIFFNALRELLGQRTFPPLYSLTSSAAPSQPGHISRCTLAKATPAASRDRLASWAIGARGPRAPTTIGSGRCCWLPRCLRWRLNERWRSCEASDGVSFAPRAPWHWLATVAALVVAGLVAAMLLLPARRPVLGRAMLARMGSAFLLIPSRRRAGAGGMEPLLVQSRAPDRLHLAVVLDNSPSVLRARGGWQQVREDVAQLLRVSVDALPDQLRADSTASISVFRDRAGEILPAPDSLADLPNRVRTLPEDALDGTGSDLAAGLLDAGERVDAAGGRGAVLLVSDGLETEGQAREAAVALAQQGIPIFVYGVASQGAELAILAADLPRQAIAGEDVLLRGTVWNSRDVAASATLSVTLNTGLRDESPRVSAATGIHNAHRARSCCGRSARAARAGGLWRLWPPVR